MLKMSFEKKYFTRRKYLSKESQIRRFILELLKWSSKVNNSNLLDGREKIALVVGCGCGFETDILNELGYEVYGLDISKFAVKYAKNTCNSGEFILSDLQTGVPFQTDVFDIVTCIDVLEHLTHPLKALVEIFRASNGAVVCTSPNRNVEQVIKTIFRDIDETHINSKSKKEWEILIKENFKPHFLKIEAFMDMCPRIRDKLLFCKYFRLPYFGLSLRMFIRQKKEKRKI